MALKVRGTSAWLSQEIRARAVFASDVSIMNAARHKPRKQESSKPRHRKMMIIN